MNNNKTNSVTLWLYTCCGMIFVMALIGAITRLTESGLSITTWEPITGALPPLSEAAWNKAFTAYQAIPQYQIFNRGMSLDEFKYIFFWEWVHRLWGRIIGLVFALLLFYFVAVRKISRAFFWKLVAIFALGGLQGFIGWLMVQSGLETRTSVSPYRLALHLSFALLLYSLLLWVAQGKNEKTANAQLGKGLMNHGWATLSLLATTIIWGAFVAGMRAGTAYNTWPLMDGVLLPDEAWNMQPVWINPVANLAFVQFIHRWLGPTTLVMIVAWVIRCWKTANEAQRRWLYALCAMAFVQVMLGITTLLTHVQIVIAVTHQAGAMILLSLMLINLRNFSAATTVHKSLTE